MVEHIYLKSIWQIKDFEGFQNIREFEVVENNCTENYTDNNIWKIIHLIPKLEVLHITSLFSSIDSKVFAVPRLPNIRKINWVLVTKDCTDISFDLGNIVELDLLGINTDIGIEIINAPQKIREYVLTLTGDPSPSLNICAEFVTIQSKKSWVYICTNAVKQLCLTGKIGAVISDSVLVLYISYPNNRCMLCETKNIQVLKIYAESIDVKVDNVRELYLISTRGDIRLFGNTKVLENIYLNSCKFIFSNIDRIERHNPGVTYIYNKR